MLIKWEGGNPQGGFPNALTCAAILVNILAVSGIPSSIPTPVTVTAGSSPTTVATGRRVPKQVGLSGGTTLATPDHQTAGTHHQHGHGFMDHHGHGHHHHGHHGDGKYFMYAHNPGYDEYEYGYRRGNDYHFQERYEKYGPAWNFKTKVKWGDKYAGYGEHYWDYNHAGSGYDDGGHGGGHHSEPVPSYENHPTGSSSHNRNVAMLHKRQSDQNNPSKIKEKRSKSGTKRIVSTSAAAPNNKDLDMQASQVPISDSKAAESRGLPMLVLDRKTGQIIDTETGRAYVLKPNARSYY